MKDSATNKLEQARIARENQRLAGGSIGTPKGQERCQPTTLELLEAMYDIEQQFAWAALGEDDEGTPTDYGLAMLATEEDRNLRSKHKKSESAEHSWVWRKIFEQTDFETWTLKGAEHSEMRLELLQDLVGITMTHIDHDEHTGNLGELACDSMVQETRAESGHNWQDYLTPDVTDAKREDLAAEKRDKLSAAGQVIAQAVASRAESSVTKRTPRPVLIIRDRAAS